MGITIVEDTILPAAQIDARKQIVPIGWHVPTDGEWTTLTTFLDQQDPAGSVRGKMKEERETPNGTWISHYAASSTNSCGFRGLAGGICLRGDVSVDIRFEGSLWSFAELRTNQS